MAVYAMSDIHGDCVKYFKMLELIHFNENDTLYILGDVIDRQEGSIEILEHMMEHCNIIPILGNHEYMGVQCMQWLLQEITDDSLKEMDYDKIISISNWFAEGGDITAKEFAKLRVERRKEIIDYILDFELYSEVEVNGNTFVLVHAGLSNFSPEKDLNDYDVTEMIFERVDYRRAYFPTKYLVTGHTPTRLIHSFSYGLAYAQFNHFGHNDTIYMKNNHIAIDCGCGYDGKLGCICLDTFEEFYV